MIPHARSPASSSGELSPSARLRSLPPEARAEFLASLNEYEAETLLYRWRGFLARPSQLAPPVDPLNPWDIWLILAGRGFGKTRAGAEFVREEAFTNGKRHIGVIAESQEDLVNYMLFGESGLLRTAAPGQILEYTQKPFKIKYANGAVVKGYNAISFDKLRGAQFDCVWADELAKWRYAESAWREIQFCLRLGSSPRQCVTTTPRPIDILKNIIAGKEGRVILTRGHTADNLANLAEQFVTKIYNRYEGTRIGLQELRGEILGDLPGALWSYENIELYRVSPSFLAHHELRRIVVAVDPAVTHTEESDMHGIVVVGIDNSGESFVLEDVSLSGTPLDWARRAVAYYDSYGADAIVIEVNQGGDMCRHTLQTVRHAINIQEVRATRGKHVRAEPISALYQQGRVHHVGSFPELETQMTQMTSSGYLGNTSPDRLDALIWALTSLHPEAILPVNNARPVFRRPSLV